MKSPTDLAAARVAAVAALEARLAGHVTEAQRLLYDGLLARLTDIYADPSLLPELLQAYQNTVLVPLAVAYGEALLTLPGLQVTYFAALEAPGYARLRAPLADFLTARLGVNAAGLPVPGGYLATIAGDTTVARQVLTYAYQAQAAGAGLEAYREGLNALVLGGDKPAQGLVETLYQESSDEFSRADRTLQTLAGRELGLTAALYQGGLIAGSRPFCIARNGRVFTVAEIMRFGTAADVYGGYSEKSTGKFSGKTSPYDPKVDGGGHSCRHTYHYLSNTAARRLRPELTEDANGRLVAPEAPAQPGPGQ